MTKLSQTSPNSNPPKPTFRLRDMVKSATDLWVFSWILGLLFALSIIALLMVSGWFITGAALAGMIAVGSHAFNYMLPAGIIRVLAMSRTASRYGELMVAHHAVFDLLKTLRVRFFNQLAKLPLTHQRHALQSSQTMHRLVSDIDKLDEFILRVVSPWLIGSITVLLLTTFIIFILPIGQTSKSLVILFMVLTLIIPLIATYFGIKQAKQLAQSSEARRHKLLAPLAIITQLILWRQWHTQTQAYIDEDKTLHQLEWRAQKRRSFYTLLIQWLVYLVIFTILVAVSMLDYSFVTSHVPTPIKSLNVDVPILLAVVLGLMGIQEIVVPLGQHYLSLGSSIAAKARLNGLLDTHNPSEADNRLLSSHILNTQTLNNKTPLPTDKLTLTLDKVSAKIPTALVGAKDVNVTVTSGIPLIIKGASGCGKSTLLQMLAGELPVLSGEVLLNNTPWHHFDWQDKLGYLGQQLDIFDQSLADNLRLGKADATDEQLRQVLDKVGLTNWLNSQPQGLHTPLGEYGIYVSGGQARRIALARLLLKPRRVLLLDEPFAGLDDKTRTQLWQHIKAHQHNDLLIVVSHHDWDMNDCQVLTLDTQVLAG